MSLEVVDDSEEKDGGKKKDTIELTPEQVSHLVKEEIDKALKNAQSSQSQESSSVADLAKMISQGVSDGMKSKTGQFEFGEGYTEEEIDADDYLEEKDWVTFAVHRLYDIIVADKRNGKVIRAPFEPIEFKIQGTKVTKNGKESSITNYATYTCKSKKELEWLKNHSMYNVRFFDKIGKAISVDAHKAGILAKNMNVLNAMNQYNIMKYAKEYGVPFSEDLSIMRAELATRMTEKEMKSVTNWQNDMFKEQMEEAQAVGKDTPTS